MLQIYHCPADLDQQVKVPVRQSLEFKLALLVFKALNDLAPQYLSENCQLSAVSGHHHLLSSDCFNCSVTSTCSRLDDRAFSAAGPRITNSLPT